MSPQQPDIKSPVAESDTRPSRAIELLKEWIAYEARHLRDEPPPPPQCPELDDLEPSR